jgi:hypothetical protein
MFTLLGFLGMYTVLSLLGCFLVWRELDRGPFYRGALSYPIGR